MGKVRLEVLHLPGHTPGLVCLWDAEHRLLFADDHLLARISPNPFLELVDERTTRRALVQYLHMHRAGPRARRRVGAAGPRRSVPGAPRGDRLAAPASTLRRQEKLLDDARPPGRARRWSCPTRSSEPQEGARLYLTLSEVVGNLEVLEDADRVRRLADGPVDRWALPG